MVVAHSTPWSWHTALHGRGMDQFLAIDTISNLCGDTFVYIMTVCWLIVEYVPFLYVDCLEHNFSLYLHCVRSDGFSSLVNLFISDGGVMKCMHALRGVL